MFFGLPGSRFVVGSKGDCSELEPSLEGRAAVHRLTAVRRCAGVPAWPGGTFGFAERRITAERYV